MVIEPDIINIINKNMKRTFVIILSIILSTSFCAKPACAQQISDQQRMEWWTAARFGMFVHWGIYSVPAGFYNGVAQTNSAEWIMNKGKIPLAEYQRYADLFNPTLFDAKEFVSLAKKAGMKYIVITSKHHDGFSMFHSKSNPFNIVDATPFKRDVLKELSEECAKQGIKFGFYYSQAQDWSHPGGVGNTWDKKMQHVSRDVYVKEKALPEVNQLLTEYGKISIFWWDTPREMSKEVIDSLYRVTTDLQPEIITNDRLGANYRGDYRTFERNLPKQKPEDKYWEICQPISGSWGYRSDDKNFKSVRTLLYNLADASSMGGNYLLNVSPTCLGTLAPQTVKRLHAIGNWMEKNSESIYDTQASPCGNPDWGCITMKKTKENTRLYLHVFNWPEDGKITVPIRNKAKNASLLVNKKKRFSTKTTSEGLIVNLKGEAPDSINSVVVLDIIGEADAIAPKKFGQNKDGQVVFNTDDAQFDNLQGSGVKYNSSKDCVGSWTNDREIVYWNFAIDTPATFDVTASIACISDSKLSVEINGQKKIIEIKNTGSYGTFKTIKLGKYTITNKGNYQITFKPIRGSWKPVNLKNVVMTPLK